MVKEKLSKNIIKIQLTLVMCLLSYEVALAMKTSIGLDLTDPVAMKDKTSWNHLPVEIKNIILQLAVEHILEDRIFNEKTNNQILRLKLVQRECNHILNDENFFNNLFKYINENYSTPVMLLALAKIILNNYEYENKKTECYLQKPFLTLEENNFNISEIEKLLHAGANFNIHGPSLLCDWNNKLITMMLIKAGAKINMKDISGQTPLIKAANNGNRHIVNLLIEKGADINAQNFNGDTALMCADRIEIIKKLIIAGANLNIQNRYGQTALSKAAYEGFGLKVLMLLFAGVNLNTQDNNGNTALHIALHNNNNNIAYALIDGTNFFIKNKQGKSAIEIAFKSSNVSNKILKKLLEAGIHIGQSDNYANTALFNSVSYRIDLVDMFIKSQSNLNLKNKKGKTFLMRALNLDKSEVAKKLIYAGADLNIKCKNGKTALMCAINRSNTDIASILINKGADINAQDKIGRTALIQAVIKNTIKDVLFLLRSEADLNLKDMYGQTALSIAKTSNKFSMVKLLRAAKYIQKAKEKTDMKAYAKLIDLYNNAVKEKDDEVFYYFLMRYLFPWMLHAKTSETTFAPCVIT